ncbi:hypothetical protein CDL15_Pgr001813 [Punica granatum]|uniref:PRP1 splicing factor N-terminal domain-containing protein n=1 Tax=Punica granatum TaxID=22663 RepID=A0A218XC14_PUNGR|nr:hypothetical protein CDL15_Pgr001813 [Punica granatum]
MPPRKTANQRRVVEEDELDRRIERIIDTRLVVALECRLDVVVDRLAERMRALMEAQHEVDPRRKRVPNPTTDLEDVKYDSYSERDVNIFIEEDPSDDAFFLAGGNGEPEFDEDDEGDDKGYDENWQFDEFEGNDVGVFASAKYDEDDKEANAVWEAINKRMDSRRKDRREARLKQEIEKYHASNQQMRTMMSDVSIELITAAEYFESRFFPIIRSRAWTNIDSNQVWKTCMFVWIILRMIMDSRI